MSLIQVPMSERIAPPEMTPRRSSLRRLCGLVTAGALPGLIGCSVLDTNPGQASAYYLFQDLQRTDRSRSAETSGKGRAGEGILMLGSVTAAALYDSDRIVYTRDGHAHAYYQFAHWGERPAKRLATLAEQRLARSGRYAAVAQSVAGIKGDWLLQLRLEDLTHQDRPPTTDSPGGRVHMRVVASLIDWRDRTLIAQQSFEQTAGLSTRDAPGAAQAASSAATALLDALESWLTQVTPAKAPTK